MRGSSACLYVQSVTIISVPTGAVYLLVISCATARPTASKTSAILSVDMAAARSNTNALAKVWQTDTNGSLPSR